MDQDQKKSAAAEAALAYVEVGDVVGVGTGTTVNHFIDFLGQAKGRIDGAVASSEATAERLSGLGIRLLDLNHLADVPLYVDGADEATSAGYLIKGGGGRINDIPITAEKALVTLTDINPQGVVKLSAGKKRHALVRPV